MKHLGISAALAAGLGMAALNPAHAANDGVINIVGSVTATTCTIEGEAPGGGTVVKDVDLLGISRSNLATPGQTAGDKAVTINIGAPGEIGCTNGDTAYVRFDPASPAIDFTTGRLNNTAATSPAGNVQIQFTNIDGSVIDIANDDSAGYEIVNNQARIPLIVRMYANGAAATVGAVASAVGFSVVYD